MIRIITLLLATLTILSNISAQNNTDSLINVYQMEPLNYTEKIGKDYFTVQNYFSKKNKYKSFGVWVFGVDNSTNNYGMLLNVENGKRNIFIKECNFLIHNLDTAHLKHRVYTAYITQEDSIVAEVPLEIKSSQTAIYNKDGKFKQTTLVHIEFEPLQIDIDTYQQIFLNTRYLDIANRPHITMTFVGSNKKLFSYAKQGSYMRPIIADKVLKPSDGNLVWQVRIKYRAY